MWRTKALQSLQLKSITRIPKSIKIKQLSTIQNPHNKSLREREQKNKTPLQLQCFGRWLDRGRCNGNTRGIMKSPNSLYLSMSPSTQLQIYNIDQHHKPHLPNTIYNYKSTISPSTQTPTPDLQSLNLHPITITTDPLISSANYDSLFFDLHFLSYQSIRVALRFDLDIFAMNRQFVGLFSLHMQILVFLSFHA